MFNTCGNSYNCRTRCGQCLDSRTDAIRVDIGKIVPAPRKGVAPRDLESDPEAANLKAYRNLQERYLQEEGHRYSNVVTDPYSEEDAGEEEEAVDDEEQAEEEEERPFAQHQGIARIAVPTGIAADSGAEVSVPACDTNAELDEEQQENRRRLERLQSALRPAEDERRRQELTHYCLEQASRREQLRTFLTGAGFQEVNERKYSKNSVLQASSFSRMVGVDYAYPLHVAVLGNNAAAVELLLWGGADRAARDSKKVTPLALAKSLNINGSHKKVIAALKASLGA